VGLAAPTVRFELHNDGGTALHLLGDPPIAITTEDRGEVAVTAFSAATIGPGESRLLELSFTPHRTGARFATVTVTSDDPEHPTCTLHLGGSGLPVAGPDIGTWAETSNFTTGRFNLARPFTTPPVCRGWATRGCSAGRRWRTCRSPC
jgi:hypothetical protein